jgi:hypothetical protein
MTVHIGGSMSSNEAVALDANFKSWQEKRFPTPPKDLNVFEYYCVDQFLRQFDLSDSQLKTGLIGGGKDGGVDALYMFVTGEPVDAETELDPKAPNQVRLLIMQMKEGDGFSPVAVDKLNFFADDLLELTRKKADYHQTYRDELIKVMRLVKDKYLGKYDLNTYLKSIQIVLAVEGFLDTLGLETVHRRNLPYWLCMYATCAKIGSAYAPSGEILKLDVSTLTPVFLHDCNDRVFKQYEKLAEKHKVNGERDYDALAKGQGGHLLKAISAELKRRFHPKKKK